MDKFSAAVWNRLCAFFAARCLPEKGGILAAVSGGPDSVCLLHFLRGMSRRHGFGLAACHVNHGIRGAAADADEDFVRRLCLNWNIRFVCAKVSAPKAAKSRKMSLEHAARALRYRALYRAAKKEGCSLVALGHHLDDHAETIILNLLRGSNPAGLLGIPMRRPMGAKFPGVEVVRPLLCVNRAEINGYLLRHGLACRTDETNFSSEYTRNWVRNELLPLIAARQPKFGEHLLELSSKLAAMIGAKAHPENLYPEL
ncbi:MAG: tRNA lysidine(34) synthetase TilS [Elusimicrobiales bacterium]